MVEKTCERCGEFFTASQSKVKWCPVCQWRPCEICGTKFRVKPKKPDQRFCSASCRTYETSRTCESCGESFSGWSKSKWCPQCMSRECKQCGTEFRLREIGRTEENIFCSHACWIESHKIRRVEKFWAKVDKSGECWLWTGGKNNRGYGLFYADKKGGELAHRIAYELVHGPIPEKAILLHSCDRPSCCNPAHLTPGTRAENIADMISKKRNRHPSGEANGLAKLTVEKARLIRQQYAEGLSYRKIARLHGVGHDAIRSIVIGRTWKVDAEQVPARSDRVHSTRTLKEISQMYADQDGLCAYCEAPLNGVYEIDHMTPVSRGGGNELDNLALACQPCNGSKGARTVEEFLLT